MKIGHVIRRLRHAQGRTLQQLCDAAGGRVAPAYLSRIERDEMAPSVYIAATIAKALGTTVDSLLKESEGGSNTSGMPAAARMLVPVLRWEDAGTFCRERDYTRLPTPERWVMPPMDTHLGFFGLVLRDDSMQSLEGISWSRGATIIVDMSRPEQADDYVLIADQSGSGAMLFRQLATDGHDHFLRARNPQYPMRPIDDSWQVLGVVIGQVIDLVTD